MTAQPHVAQFDGVARPAETKTRPSPAFKVSAYRDLAAVLDIWAELEAVVPHSVYQSRRWVVPWLETIGAAHGVSPFFVVLRDRFQAPVGLIPLGVRRVGPLRVAGLLGGKDANFGLPLIRPDVTVGAPDLTRLLREATRQYGAGRPAAVGFLNLPARWEEVVNPLGVLTSQPSPSFAYETALPATGEAFMASTLSKDTRKKLRRKESRLAEIAPVHHTMAETSDSADAILAAFTAQKTARLSARGIASEFGDAAMQRFLHRTSLPSSTGSVELHALVVGERIVATLLGATYRDRFSGMVNSFDEDPEIARSSPGDLLLSKVIAAKCRDGIATFDLGIGEARYKDMFCPHAVPLADSVVALTPLGAVVRPFWLGALRLKRWAKRSPHARRVLALVRRVRA